MDISVCSYNCCSAAKNIELIREIVSKNVDIIFLQETLVTYDNVGIFDCIDENYKHFAVGAVYSQKSIESASGRPSGGLCCLYRSDADFKLKVVTTTDNFVALNLCVGRENVLLINCYVRSDLGDVRSYDNYLNELNLLEDMVNTNNFDNIFMCGDFNADPYIGRSWDNLKEFMARNLFKCYDYDQLPSDTITHINYGTYHCKWLDHIIGRSYNNVIVKDITILEDIVGSDHLPLFFSLNLPNCDISNQRIRENYTSNKNYIDWTIIDEKEVKNICDIACDIQGHYYDMKISKCRKIGCQDQKCLGEIEQMYDVLVDSVNVALAIYKKNKISLNKYKQIPGWNRVVKNAYKTYRESFKAWLHLGRPRNHLSLDLMNIHRKRFKNTLKDCRSNENREVILSIEDKFNKKSATEFWKCVKKKTNKKSKIDNIDGYECSTDVVNVFVDRFISSSVDYKIEDENEYNSILNSHWDSQRKQHVCISKESVRILIKHLNVGVGHDNIHKNILNFANEQFVENLVYLLNSCFSHCFLPKKLLRGDITPILKDDKGNRSSSDNFRPVMQSSAILKLFELHLLNFLEEKIPIHSSQFGFKKDTSTTDACFLVKETVHNYTSNNVKVYSNFIDLSKAFDLVNHFKLGKILLQKNVPPDIVKILIHYLRNQSARVKWYGDCGEFLSINNGVRQGGIMSPFLFKVYIGEILETISKLEYGCKLGLSRVNIVAYADDIILIADSLENLERMYIIFKNFIDNLDLKINISKSKIMIFSMKAQKDNNINSITLGNSTFEVVKQYKYLGFVLTNTLCDEADVKDKLNSFYRCFNSFYRNFNGLNLDILLYLFNVYTLPNYGISLWSSTNIKNKINFKTFCVAFNSSFKKMLQVSKYSSSHIVASVCQSLLFNHHVALNQARFYKSNINSKNPVFILNKIYLDNGLIRKNICSMFKKEYSIFIHNMSVDIIKSRVSYVQNHECI